MPKSSNAGHDDLIVMADLCHYVLPRGVRQGRRAAPVIIGSCWALGSDEIAAHRASDGAVFRGGND